MDNIHNINPSINDKQYNTTLKISCKHITRKFLQIRTKYNIIKPNLKDVIVNENEVNKELFLEEYAKCNAFNDIIFGLDVMVIKNNIYNVNYQWLNQIIEEDKPLELVNIKINQLKTLKFNKNKPFSRLIIDEIKLTNTITFHKNIIQFYKTIKFTSVESEKKYIEMEYKLRRMAENYNKLLNDNQTMYQNYNKLLNDNKILQDNACRMSHNNKVVNIKYEKLYDDYQFLYNDYQKMFDDNYELYQQVNKKRFAEQETKRYIKLEHS